LKSELPHLIKENKLSKDELDHKEAEIRFLEEIVHGNTKFPNNVAIMNFLDYLLVPSLVYWMEYPRTEKNI
jgi:sterol O-acyltransferase